MFAHSNQTVATPSFRLHEAGIDHYLVGLPDAEADALAAMLAITRFAYGEISWADVRIALGTYLAACTRGKHAPQRARDFASGAPLPKTLQARAGAVQLAATTAAESSLVNVADVAATAWTVLGIIESEAPWCRAAPSFRTLARNTTCDPSAWTTNLGQAVSQVRAGAMFESQRRRLPAVQVMNMHQTKGREVDAVVILSGDEDFHGYESEPFAEGSRLLYVLLTNGTSWGARLNSGIWG